MLHNLVNLLGNRFVEQNHLPLVGFTGIHLALLDGLLTLSWESLLDLLEFVEQEMEE
jgi:hypothetical protein